MWATSPSFPEAAMATTEEIERRLEVVEATWRAIFRTAPGGLIMLQGGVLAPGKEGFPSEKMTGGIGMEAQPGPKKATPPGRTPPMTSEIATQLDSLAERL